MLKLKVFALMTTFYIAFSMCDFIPMSFQGHACFIQRAYAGDRKIPYEIFKERYTEDEGFRSSVNLAAVVLLFASFVVGVAMYFGLPLVVLGAFMGGTILAEVFCLILGYLGMSFFLTAYGFLISFSAGLVCAYWAHFKTLS